jgi:hypothetical protein
MKLTIKPLLITVAAFVCYFAAYFVTVQREYLPVKTVRIAVPVYRPFNSVVVKVIFAPAHFVDAEYLRNAHWYSVKKL